MAVERDILLTEAGRLQFANGDFVIGESTEQHVAHILAAAPGEYKEFPLLGADLKKAINGNVGSNLLRNIRVQLMSDGYSIEELSINGNELNINVSR